MVSGTKFFIYGGGRWREVNIDDGRVEGWGRARFAYPRRGKVQVAKTRAVLAGLRDLAAGQKSVVKDGIHLPYKKNEVMKKKEEKNQESACDHSHCCHHSNNNNGCIQSRKKQIPKINSGVQCVPKIDTGIQTSLPSQTLTFPETFNEQNSRKRRREATTSEDDIPSEVTTTAMVHTSSSKNLPKLVPHKRRPVTISSEENDSVTHKKRVPSLKLSKADSAKYNIYQRKRTNSSDSIVWVVLPKSCDEKQHPEVKEYIEPKSRSDLKKKRHGASPKSRLLSEKTVDQIKAKARSNTRQKAVETSIVSSDENDDKLKANPQTASNVKKRQDQCKELVIDERDVDILRNYLMTHAKNFDLLKFDEDDEYKKRFFFKINPLVNVERCPQIARMLTGDGQEVISLKDFASQLGLRSVSELSSVPRRHRIKKSKELKNLRDDSDTEEENSDVFVKNKSKKMYGYSHKQTNAVKTNEDGTDSSDSDTDSKLYEKYNERRISDRIKSNTLNSPQKKYITRQSGDKMNRSGLVEIFSSKDNKIQVSDDSSEDEFLKSSKQNKRVKRKVNKVTGNPTLDLTISSDNESNAVKTKKIDNVNLIQSNGENSDVEYVKSSKAEHRSRTTKTNSDKSQANRRKHSKVQNSDEEEIESNKEINTRAKYQSNRSKIVFESSDNEILRKVESNINTNKISTNDKRNRDSSESNEENSDSEALKTSNETKKRTRNKENIDEKHKTSKESNRRYEIKENNVRTKTRTIDISKEINTESSDEAFKSSKKFKRTDQSKTSSKNKNIKDTTDSSEETDLDIAKTSKESNRGHKDGKNTRNHTNHKDSQSSDEENYQKPRNKENNSKIKANRHHVESDEEIVKTKENDQRPQNKGINNIKVNRYHVESDKNLEEVTKRERNREKNERDENKRNANEVKSKETSKKNHNLVNSTKNTSNDDVATNGTSSHKPVLKLKPVKSKHTGIPSLREYSSLEDQAIVSWISVGGRALCVNGNRIWRELQQHYTNITGQTRSWHSLRNRYLRYILPKLGTMALPPSQEARLRAAAATGEIKSRKRPARRNSIFEAPVRGALSRRPRAAPSTSTEEPPPKVHRHDHSRKPTPPSPKRALRPSLPPSPSKRLPSPTKRPPSPRYSDITRRFAATRRQDEFTPNTSPTKKSQESKTSSKKSTKLSLTEKSQESKSSSTKKSEIAKTTPSKITTEDRKNRDILELSTKQRTSSQESSTKSLRRSFRLKDAPAQETQKSPEKERPRTRRLFNPSTML